MSIWKGVAAVAVWGLVWGVAETAAVVPAVAVKGGGGGAGGGGGGGGGAGGRRRPEAVGSGAR